MSSRQSIRRPVLTESYLDMLAPTPSAQALALPETIRTRGKGLRPQVRTVTEAMRLIDQELPAELRSLPRWTFARELLVHAERSRKKRDLTCAVRQLRQALNNEGWLVEKD